MGGVDTGALRAVPMNAFTPSRVTRFVRIKAVAGPTRAPSGEQTLPAFDTLDQRVRHILAALFMRIKSARQKGGRDNGLRHSERRALSAFSRRIDSRPSQWEQLLVGGAAVAGRRRTGARGTGPPVTPSPIRGLSVSAP